MLGSIVCSLDPKQLVVRDRDCMHLLCLLDRMVKQSSSAHINATIKPAVFRSREIFLGSCPNMPKEDSFSLKHCSNALEDWYVYTCNLLVRETQKGDRKITNVCSLTNADCLAGMPSKDTTDQLIPVIYSIDNLSSQNYKGSILTKLNGRGRCSTKLTHERKTSGKEGEVEVKGIALEPEGTRSLR